ncbi:hypothetical protein DW169_17595 [Bacteroides intestinalis]|uniref:hypothetical protein n=1 Tax=Bacteroides intestinalis TaxID=329854 RepID=UPI000E51AF43|nr:hypothetical protein [Bacteroides intestinalis]RHI29777.1 hypothetical protein DW169_17595 [Bacteroides intestinalis]
MNDVKIDKLKICYKVQEGSFINILRKTPDAQLDYEVGFSLERIEGTHYNYIYEIRYTDYEDNSCTYLAEQTLGTISFGLRSDKDEALKDYVWLHIDNKQLYLKYDGITSNRTIHIDYITDYLKLEYNNVTNLDLAIDSPTNYPKKLIALLRNENYVPIINGDKVMDREALIEEVLYLGVGNLKRIKEYNILISQKKAIKNKSMGMSLMIYNKNREIENRSGKEYIRELYGKPKRLYRIEVRVNSDALKGLFQKEQIPFSVKLLWDKDFLFYLFLTFGERIIRFQSVKGRKVCGLLELI